MLAPARAGGELRLVLECRSRRFWSPVRSVRDCELKRAEARSQSGSRRRVGEDGRPEPSLYKSTNMMPGLLDVGLERFPGPLYDVSQQRDRSGPVCVEQHILHPFVGVQDDEDAFAARCDRV